MKVIGQAYGTEAQIAAYSGNTAAPGQIVWSTDGHRLHVMDGNTKGGYAVAMSSDLNSYLGKTATAAAATKLATKRTISATGDASWSVQFDGSGNASAALTLANSGATAGTYGPTAAATLAFGGSVNIPKVVVDAKGRVTSIAHYAIKLPAAPTSVTSATKATQDASGNVITSTYATKTECNNKIPKSGSAGTVSCYESVGTNTTINQSSPSSIQTSSAVSVSNGTSNTCWVKVARLTGSSPSVTLGSSWKWQGGSTPTLKQNCFIVCCWCGSGGIAIVNNIS